MWSCELKKEWCGCSTCMFEAGPVLPMSCTCTVKGLECTEERKKWIHYSCKTHTDRIRFDMEIRLRERPFTGAVKVCRSRSRISEQRVNRLTHRLGEASQVVPSLENTVKNLVLFVAYSAFALMLRGTFCVVLSTANWPPAEHTICLRQGSWAGEWGGRRCLEWHTFHPENKHSH